MKNLIRIEHPKDGIGIFYRTNEDRLKLTTIKLKTLINRHENKFPTPYMDGLNLRKFYQDWFCGYKSIEEVKKWITPRELKVLISHGYKIYSINVTQYQEGNYQIIFTQEGILEKEECTELFIESK